MKLNNSLVTKGEYIHLNAPSLEMYIPQDYFENKLAEDLGGYFSVFGLLNVRLFDNDNKPYEMELMNLPSMIEVFPSIVERKSIVLKDGEEPEKVVVCRFLKEDKIMRSSIAQSSKAAELFVNMMIRGKVPKSVPYDKVLTVWNRNLEMNGVNLGVPSAILEIIVSEVYRNAKKPEEAFRFEYGKNPKTDPFGYSTANMREICAKNSTFSAVTFEDLDSMIVSSVNRSIYNKEEAESPLEKIIKY